MEEWEEKLEGYKKDDFKKRIQELEEKYNAEGKSKATKEEYFELEKLKKIEANLPKVEHLLEYKKVLNSDLKKITEELNRRAILQKANRDIQKMDKKMAELDSKQAKIEEQLNDKDLDKDIRQVLVNKKAQILKDKDANNIEYSKKQQLLQNGLSASDEFKDKTNSELKAMKEEIGNNKIKQLDVAAEVLLDGGSWEQIEYKLKQTKDEKKVEEPIKLNNKEYSVIDNDEEEKIIEIDGKEDTSDKERIENSEDENIINDTSDENKETELEEEDTFAARHPRLAKIRDFFKRIVAKFTRSDRYEYSLPKPNEEYFKDKNFDNDDNIIDDKEFEETFLEQLTKGVKDVKEKSFIKELKEIADKGLDGIEAEKKAEKVKNAKENLAKMRKENREEEARKYGEEYAKQSDYRDYDDEER